MSKNQTNFVINSILILILSAFVSSALISVKNNKVDTEIPNFELKCEVLTGYCYAESLILNRTHKHFIPLSTIPAEKVKIIHLGGHPEMQSSVMHTLTSDLCKAFPNLKIIDAKYLNLHEIEEHALRECLYLEAVYLANNQLNELDENLFKYNKNLEKVRLEDNALTKIDLTLFEELRHLNELGFDGQLLSEFHVNKVRHRGIIKLIVQFNDKSVMEMDEMGISEVYSHLSSFIPCYRDRSIIRLELIFEPFAKLYCFERPGNLNEQGELIVDSERVLENRIE